MKRNDIQALRGIAVLSVLLYHLQIRTFKGGFLGVDIFFVISGFVITTRLQAGEGAISNQILDFYRRRAKRILPASLTVILLTAVAIRLFLSPLSWHRFGLDGLASTFFIGNFRFAAQGNNYLNQSMSPTPYLHYWSLGVEEQFYILWPLLFLFIFKSRRYLLLLFTILSTAFALWYTFQAPVDSFYQPFSRAWEFLGGSLIAFFIRKPIAQAKTVAICGWIAISASFFLIGSELAIPGVTTLVPVCGAMAVLSAQEKMPWERALAKFGDSSFAIYLIHWPLIVIALTRYQGLSLAARLGISIFSLLGGFLISSFIENPFRFDKRLLIPLPLWGVGLLSAGAIVFGATNIASATPTVASARIDITKPIIYLNKCHLDFGVSKPSSPCLFGDLNSQKLVVLTGDSHAAQWFDALEKIALVEHWKLLSLTKSSCPASFLPTKRNGFADRSCVAWQKYVAARIKSEHPLKVFLSGFSEEQYPLLESGDYPTLYAHGEESFITALDLPPTSVYYIEDTPRPPGSIPDCLVKNSHHVGACNFPLSRTAATLAVERALHGLGVHYLNFTRNLCPGVDGKCLAIFAGHNTYRDASHLSVSTAVALAINLQNSLSQ